ncbi:MAG: flippase-like domain-containing protein [Gammaproteobacteria bacterium]|nr:flippase-like domain-containing protein [Gammaproteobacteria bacterium]
MFRFAKLAFLLLGIGLLGLVLLKTDLAALWAQVTQVGVLGMAAVLLVYALYFGADAVSWQLVLPAVGLDGRWAWRVFAVRMIGEAYNNITPTASLGGEPVKAWILKNHWGIPLRDAGASLVIAKTTSMFSLVLFVGIGVVMLLLREDLAERHKLLAAAGFAWIAMSAVVFYLMQHHRLSTWVARRLGRTRFGQRLERVLVAAEDIDRQFAAFYSGHRARLAGSFAFAMLNWILGVLEVWLILRFIGQPMSFSEVWMIECMVQLVRTLAFFIPAGLGAQEGAFLIGVGALSGVPSSGVAVALVRRFRDVLWIGASLLLASAWAVRPSSVRGERLDPAEP